MGTPNLTPIKERPGCILCDDLGGNPGAPGIRQVHRGRQMRRDLGGPGRVRV